MVSYFWLNVNTSLEISFKIIRTNTLSNIFFTDSHFHNAKSCLFL